MVRVQNRLQQKCTLLRSEPRKRARRRAGRRRRGRKWAWDRVLLLRTVPEPRKLLHPRVVVDDESDVAMLREGPGDDDGWPVLV